ncbi:uncharacterized protein LOC143289511 [Babylonia areolata]|uniref:uncharacterized protein LOC143289511 n=1 Tax=Babylonia areolata TaxID=304850 RepID=UPI003FD5F42B
MPSLRPSLLHASAILLLLSCALARSLNDETLPKEALDVVAGATGGSSDLYDDPKALADLWDFLVSSGHVTPYDQSAAGRGAEEGARKRSWPNGAFVPSSMKRKMFWTPLGHLPASARLGRPQNLRPNMEESGSPVFRYG